MLPSFWLSSQNSQYRFRHLTTNEGLSAPSVYSVAKDKKGFVWLATGIGLYRYDGYDFKYYRSNPNDSTSLSDNLLTAHLFVEASGYLWVGTNNKGLNRFNISNEKCERFFHDPLDPKSLSNNSVHEVYQDKSGIIWIATQGGGINRFNSNNKTFSSFYPNPNELSGEENYIQSIIELNHETLLAGTRKGLYLFDKIHEQFITFPDHQNKLNELDKEFIVDIIPEKEVIWIATENGLIRYDRSNNKMIRYQSHADDESSLSSNIISQMINAVDKRYLWISTVWGLNQFDKSTGKIKRFLYDAEDENSLGYNMLWGMHLDSSNLLWIGTDNAGVNILNLNRNPFRHHKIGGVPPVDQQYTATVFHEKSNGDFWIGTFEGGLWQYDGSMNFKEHYSSSGRNPNSLAGNSVFSLCEDMEGALWVGTSEGGVNRIYQNQVSRFKIETGNTSKPPTSVIEIIQDDKGILWIGTLTGLFIFDKKSGRGIENIGFDPLNNALIRSICNDRNENIWIGTHSEGLFKLEKKNRHSLRFTNYQNQADDPGSISSNIVMSVYEDFEGTIWVATNQGLNRYIPELDKFETFDTKSGLEADYLYHIQGDGKGMLWITSSNGLMRFDPGAAQDQKSRLFEFQRDIPFGEIYPYSFYLRKSGEICVGGKYGSDYGYYTFHPDSLNDNTNIPEIVVTSFKVRNEPFVTDSAIISEKNLKLRYDQNFFSFEFAALDYTNSQRNLYRYKLEGFDEDWNYTGNRRFANYTGAPPGDYTFRVKGSNNDGYWNEEGTSLVITILPPPWKTWWAYLIYILVFFGIIISMFYYYIRRQQLVHALELEHVESEKLKELDSMKTRFFANISHEFRTPLTLILGPLEKLLSKVSDDTDKKELNIAQKHAKSLQNLINQLLTISKLEAGKMQLNATEINIVGLVKNYTQAFGSLARQKDIELSFESDRDEITTFIDREKFEQVLNNLLSNAFKFTDDGGEVVVSVNSRQSAVIKISDTGVGIQKEDLSHIFDRFYQVKREDSTYYQGTGIGLALTKELVELHYGTIQVKSEPGKGSAFTIYLPLGKDHLKPVEIRDEKPGEIEGQPIILQPPDTSTKEVFVSESLADDDVHPILLIVEDNADMRSYIRGYFENEFNIIETADGQEGYEKSIEIIPDIIISDLMMPRMDGNEFCSKVKTDERTSHIPFILLTARVSKESRIEGLETGADDFITKPFDGDELQVRVKNLVEQRKRLSDLLERKLQKSHGTVQIEFEDSGITSMDEKFLQKVVNTLKEHHSNPEFTVEDFSSKIGLSRIQLHRKIKALTRQTTGEFIRIFRLNRAAELIKMKSATVAEIAYDVGFNSPSYFTECFRKQFGKLPSEYEG